jgi:hypothetical protein
MAKTKAEVDKEVRSAGESLIDLSDLVATSGNTWIGKTTVDGSERFFEIKVTAKKDGFSEDDVNAILTERAEVESRKAERAEAAAAKKSADEKRRAEAKAKAEAAKAEKEKGEG